MNTQTKRAISAAKEVTTRLNDQLRRAITNLETLVSPEVKRLGFVVMTPGVGALQFEQQRLLFSEVALFEDFSELNDPHKEHDFGRFKLFNEWWIWKVDYYARPAAWNGDVPKADYLELAKQLEGGSDEPHDVAKTVRVITVMNAEEY